MATVPVRVTGPVEGALLSRPPGHLSAAFRRDGFCVLDDLVATGELGSISAIYDELFAAGLATRAQYRDLVRPADEPGPDLLAQVEAPEDEAPWLLATAFVRRAIALGALLLDARPVDLDVWTHMIRKEARLGPPTPWHQDEAYWPPDVTYRSVSIWMPLEDATAASGCMQFVPSSHRGPVLSHHRLGGRSHALEVDDADTSSAVACPVRAGAATAHHSRTLHYAGPNTSDHPRRAWVAVVTVADSR